MLNRILAMLLAGGSPGGTPEEQKRAMLMNFGVLALMMVVMWVAMIRPQQKKAKEQALLLKGLKRGDKVATTSGILGVVTAVRDDSVSLRSGDSQLEMQKSAVTQIMERAS